VARALAGAESPLLNVTATCETSEADATVDTKSRFPSGAGRAQNAALG
jgi:hypothetical protein